jgi:hypothetical protein
MQFVLKLLGLLLIIVVAGGLLLWIVAKLKGTDPWAYISGENAENRWAWIFLLALGVIGVIACFNWGPALLLPEKHPTPKQREGIAKAIDFFWYGTNVPVATEAPLEILDPNKPLSWRHGTWFWWKAFLLGIPFVGIWFIWAYHDDILKLIAEWKKRHREKMEAEKHDDHHDDKKHHHGSGKAHDVGEVVHNTMTIVTFLEMLVRIVSDFRRKK